ncbi:MAG: hypothetical protein PUJ07_04540 [Eubacteriales bacterium]|nr:hypothetical protein [Eubacteriales bacterium]
MIFKSFRRRSNGLDMTVEYGWDLSKTDYNDKGDISDYAVVPMSWCFNNHIMFIHSINGYEYALYPNVAPTRADTATMFYNFAYTLNHANEQQAD